MKDKPTYPCYNCGGTDYYLLDNGWGPPIWRCSKCHPRPSVLTAEGYPPYQQVGAQMGSMSAGRGAKVRSPATTNPRPANKF